MPIDDCSHTFSNLSQRVLPAYYRLLERSLRRPHRPAEFNKKGHGPRSIADRLGHATGDFSGCYVILSREKPIYVGISRTVLGRLRNHVNGTSEYTATLAYRMANMGYSRPGSRKAKMKRPDFKRRFRKAQRELARASAAFVKIENPVELHLFEVYAAMKLDTSPLNTFETH